MIQDESYQLDAWGNTAEDDQLRYGIDKMIPDPITLNQLDLDYVLMFGWDKWEEKLTKVLHDHS